MRAILFPMADHDPSLTAREAVCRIAQSIPVVVVDWAQGNEELKRTIRRLEAINAPAIIVDGHRARFENQVVHLTMSFPEFPSLTACCWVWAYEKIELRCTDGDAVAFLTFAAKAIPIALGYGFEIIE